MLKIINTKILLSGITLLAAAALVIGGTFAWFSDSETSKGNVLAAGSIDLKVDNMCYYNGDACVDGVFEGTNVACSCAWEPKDLEQGDLFFSLHDLKPGDWEEDTISLTVDNNDSWLCADVTLRSDEDNSITEPENEDGDDGSDDQGELADAVKFLWWADDGDNVLEDDEHTLRAGPMGVLNVGQTATVALADSDQNIWGQQGPFPGGKTRYVGKGFCFGDITLAPVAQDGEGALETNGPNSPRGGGFTCDGELEGNQTQTDSFTADISFRAVQSRNNPDFQCKVPNPA